MDFYSALTEKWGAFSHVQHWYEQISTTFISDKSKLNLLYESCGKTQASTLFTNIFGIAIPDQLAEFYAKYNGCRLFSDSLCIYGFHMHSDEIYEPFDISKENDRLQFDVKHADDYVFFGSLGGQYLLAYSKESPIEVLAINIDNSKIVKRYRDFESCFNTIFEKLINEYDEQGKKKHVDKKLLDMPVLANMTFDKKFL